MTNSEQTKIDDLKQLMSESVYSKYLTDAYFLRDCSDGYDECEMAENKMLLDLYEYQIKGSYINCQY